MSSQQTVYVGAIPAPGLDTVMIHPVTADEPRLPLEAELRDGEVDSGGREGGHPQAQAGRPLVVQVRDQNLNKLMSTAAKSQVKHTDLEESVPGERLGGDDQALVVAVTAPGHGVAVTQTHITALVVMELKHPGGGDLLPGLLGLRMLSVPGLCRLHLLLEDAVQTVRQVTTRTLLLRSAHLKKEYKIGQLTLSEVTFEVKSVRGPNFL